MLSAVTASLPILGRPGSSGLLLAAWMREVWQFHPDFTQQSAISIERQS